MNMDINFPNLHIYLEHVGKNINVFGITIAYYGMIIALGMLLGVSLILHGQKKTDLTRINVWISAFLPLFLP